MLISKYHIIAMNYIKSILKWLNQFLVKINIFKNQFTKKYIYFNILFLFGHARIAIHFSIKGPTVFAPPPFLITH